MLGITVYIANLDEKVDERNLYEIMVQAGPLVSLSIPKLKRSRQRRAYGFAEYTTEESAVYAVKLFTGLVTLYGKTLIFRIAGRNNISAPVIDQEAHGLFHKYQFTRPTLKSSVGYRIPYIFPGPHLQAEQMLSHLTLSTQVIHGNGMSRFKPNNSHITATAIDHFHHNANQPKPKRWASDRCTSSDAIEIQRLAS